MQIEPGMATVLAGLAGALALYAGHLFTRRSAKDSAELERDRLDAAQHRETYNESAQMRDEMRVELTRLREELKEASALRVALRSELRDVQAEREQLLDKITELTQKLDAEKIVSRELRQEVNVLREQVARLHRQLASAGIEVDDNVK